MYEREGCVCERRVYMREKGVYVREGCVWERRVAVYKKGKGT